MRTRTNSEKQCDSALLPGGIPPGPLALLGALHRPSGITPGTALHTPFVPLAMAFRREMLKSFAELLEGSLKTVGVVGQTVKKSA